MEEKTKKNAFDARSFIELHRLGILSTISLSQSGFPFGSIVPYDIDLEGRLTIYISLIAEHYKNLKADARSSLLVLDPFGVFDPQARARATVLTNFEPVPEDESESVQKRYLERFPDSINYEIAHNFQFFRSTPLKVRWIGGFGDISWISAENLQSATCDPVAYHGIEIVDHMNEDHPDALIDLVRAHSSLDLQGARVEMVSVNSSSFEIAISRPGKQKRIRIDFPARLQNVSESRTAMIELLKAARAKIAQSAND